MDDKWPIYKTPTTITQDDVEYVSYVAGYPVSVDEAMEFLNDALDYDYELEEA